MKSNFFGEDLTTLDYFTITINQYLVGSTSVRLLVEFMVLNFYWCPFQYSSICHKGSSLSTISYITLSYCTESNLDQAIFSYSFQIFLIVKMYSTKFFSKTLSIGRCIHLALGCSWKILRVIIHLTNFKVCLKKPIVSNRF